MTDQAPPLGQRPSEPIPGSPSLEDPRGQKAADGGARDICSDCGLPFGEHPDTHLHSGGEDSRRWADVDLDGDAVETGDAGDAAGDSDASTDADSDASDAGNDADVAGAPGVPSTDADDDVTAGFHSSELPGQELDEDELGGDPAAA